MKKFILLSNNVAIDFCNTFVQHTNNSEEWLRNENDVESFLYQTVREKIEVPKNEYEIILSFRKNLRDILFLLSTGKKSHTSSAFQKINHLFQEFAFTPLVKFNNNFDHSKVNMSWTVSKSQSKSKALNCILLSFVDLLSHAELERFRKCSNPGCSHLFYDMSKSGNRAWCSMKSCGNIIKARRFYSRKKVSQNKTISRLS